MALTGAVPEQPERLLHLLWAPPSAGKRGPKPAFTREAVVEAAVRLADSTGLTDFSMRAVAESLGMGTMSLYRYVPGRDELLALMVDAVTAETPFAYDGGEGWRRQLEYVARGDWDMYLRHPWMLELPLDRISPGPNATARFDAAVAAALSTGLAPRDALNAYSTVDHIVRGSAGAAIQNAQLVEATGVGIDEWWTRQAAQLESLIDYAQHPALQFVVEQGAFGSEPDSTDTYRDSFESALKLVLDGVQLQIDNVQPSQTE